MSTIVEMGAATQFVLLVLACPVELSGQRDCVAVIEETVSVAECRSRYKEIKATLPPSLHLGFPECVSLARLRRQWIETK